MILRLLTERDLKRLKVSPAEVSRGLSALDKYRVLALLSPAGDAARGLFDHGRGCKAFSRWCQG
ncbi:hypothetical protein A5725_20040 [Mycobacterium kubicae]|nr:hypothetical protein A5725_20040 [Mycobacterium kubicae]